MMINAHSGSIMRSWRGWIQSEDRDRYRAYLEETGLNDYRATHGNLGAIVVFRDVADGRCEVRTLSWWESLADITSFAGDDIDAAVFYPEDDRFLVDRDTFVEHFEVG